MKIAFVLFDGVTLLDFVGFFDVVTRLGRIGAIEDLSWDLCAVQQEITDDRGIKVAIDKVSPDLGAYDLLFVPGGFSTRQLQHDTSFITWLKTAQEVEFKASVCTGALLIGAAGFLQGKRATTNPSAYEMLEPYCNQVEKTRLVRDGNVFTGGAVAVAIDLGLFIAESLTNFTAVEEVQRQLDYPYYQPGTVSEVYNLPYFSIQQIIGSATRLLRKTELFEERHEVYVMRPFQGQKYDMSPHVEPRGDHYVLELFERGQRIMQKTTDCVEDVIYWIIDDVLSVVTHYAILDQYGTDGSLQYTPEILREEKRLLNQAFEKIGGAYERLHKAGRRRELEA